VDKAEAEAELAKKDAEKAKAEVADLKVKLEESDSDEILDLIKITAEATGLDLAAE
jgi:hypothetical protein